MTITLPPVLVDADPSAKLVWVVLDEAGPLSAPEIAAQSGLSESGVYNKLTVLQHRGTVSKRPDPTDARKSLYYTDTKSAFK